MARFYSVFDKYYYWILLALLIYIPLYPKFPLLNVSGTYVAVRAEDVLIFFAVLIWLAGNLPKLGTYLRQTIFQSFLLFWLIGGLSVVSALLITFSVQPNLGLLHWLRRVEYMSLFFLAATSITSAKRLKIVVVTFLLTMVIVVIYGFGQRWLDFPVVSTTNKEFSKGLILMLTNDARVNSTFAGHYDLAVYLSIALIVISSLFFYYKNIFYKLWLGGSGLLGFVLLGFTAARVSFAATLLGMTLVFWLSKKRWIVAGLFFAALTLLAIVPDLRHRMVATLTVNLLGGGGPKYNPPADQVTIFTPIKKLPEQSRAALRDQALREATMAGRDGTHPVDTVPGEPVNSTELGVYRSLGIRLNVEWPRALRAFYKNPALGTGYSSLTLATDNDILRSLGETGLLGTISLGLIFLIIFKKMFYFLRTTGSFESYFTLGIFCSTIALLLSAVFIDVLESSKVAEVFWLLLGASWAAMKNFKKD